MRVLIAGGGNVGLYVARRLSESGHEVVILELDSERVEHAKSHPSVAGLRWVVGDSCDVNDLVKAEASEADVVVAVTGDDEDNLVTSLLAKQEFGVPRVIARVKNPDNEWLFDRHWGVDVAVSTPHLITAVVEEALSVGTLVRLLSFGGGELRLMEVTLEESSPAVGRTIAELDLPRDSSIVAVVRGGHVLIPRGDTLLTGGDEVVVLVSGEHEKEIRTVFES
ncbi:MAG: potassium transporter TrkA [Acidimicrobiales bacterium]|nr:MAG: potassium transporter TrkA [Acidimicrobiales bacterium]